MVLLTRMDTACCGCTVKSLSLFFLYLSLVSTIFSFVSFSTKVTPEKRDEIERYINTTVVPKDVPNRDEVVRSYTNIAVSLYEWGLSTYDLNELVWLVIVSLCLYGIHKRRASFMVPWLIYDGVVLVLFAFVFTLLIVAMLVATVSVGAPFTGFVLITFILSLAFVITYYIFLIVYNCYVQIKEQREVYLNMAA